MAYIELKEYDLARAGFSQAISLNPDYVYAYYDRAALNRERRHHEQTIADYSKVIELIIPQ